MAGTAPRPYPLAPLLAAARVDQGSLGRLVNASGSAVCRAAAEGLTLSEADRWSFRLGLMPEFVWPDIFLAVTEGVPV